MLGFAVASLLGVAVWGQKAAVVNGSANPAGGTGRSTKALPTPGYLTKSGTTLRFATPPKPPAAGLPPLPISLDPQPTYSEEWASAIPDGFRPARTNTMTQASSPNSIPARPVATVPAPNNVSTSTISADSGTINPQVLIKYFSNGKPAGFEVYPGDAARFQPPVREERRSSSASYELK